MLAAFVPRLVLPRSEYTAQVPSSRHDLGVRIGVHTGKVVGGIIGTVRFHYDMWGPGVMGAAHMESHGERGRVVPVGELCGRADEEALRAPPRPRPSRRSQFLTSGLQLYRSSHLSSRHYQHQPGGR